MNYLAIALICIIGLFIIKRIFMLMSSKDKRSDIPDVAEDIALASKVAAAIAAICVYFLTPAGLFAIFMSPPLVVVIAPAIGAFAVGAYVVYALAKLHDKNRKKKEKDLTSVSSLTEKMSPGPQSKR
jgi:purine-cytosine permease-like protein